MGSQNIISTGDEAQKPVLAIRSTRIASSVQRKEPKLKPPEATPGNVTLTSPVAQREVDREENKNEAHDEKVRQSLQQESKDETARLRMPTEVKKEEEKMSYGFSAEKSNADALRDKSSYEVDVKNAPSSLEYRGHSSPEQDRNCGRDSDRDADRKDCSREYSQHKRYYDRDSERRRRDREYDRDDRRRDHGRRRTHSRSRSRRRRSRSSSRRRSYSRNRHRSLERHREHRDWKDSGKRETHRDFNKEDRYYFKQRNDGDRRYDDSNKHRYADSRQDRPIQLPQSQDWMYRAPTIHHYQYRYKSSTPNRTYYTSSRKDMSGQSYGEREKTPPSPDVTVQLKEMATAYGLDFHEMGGLDQPQKFAKSLFETNSILIQHGQSEAHLWDEQRNEAKMIRVLLGLEDGPFNSLTATHSENQSNDNPEKIPFEAQNDACTDDPRMPYKHLYDVLQKKWAKSFNFPLFQKKGDVSDSEGPSLEVKHKKPLPQYSWSHVPSGKEEPEISSINAKKSTSADDRTVNKTTGKEHQTDSLGRQEKRKTDENGFIGKKRKPHKDLEEGFFEVQLPDGKTVESGQLTELYTRLVLNHVAPPGWPAYRKSDNLWVPLEKEIALLDVAWRQEESQILDNDNGQTWIDLALEIKKHDDSEHDSKKTTLDLEKELEEISQQNGSSNPLNDLKYTVWVPTAHDKEPSCEFTVEDFEKEIKNAEHALNKRRVRINSMHRYCVGHNLCAANRTVPAANLIAGVRNAILDPKIIANSLKKMVTAAVMEARKKAKKALN